MLGLPDYTDVSDEEQRKICKSCSFRQRMPHPGGWCYMFREMLTGCLQYLNGDD